MADRTQQRSWLRFALQSGRNSLPTWASTDVVPMVGAPRHELIQDGVDRNILGPSFGASERLPGQPYRRYACTVEMAASGTAGTAPPWDKLLRACGVARTDISGDDANCQYRPVSTGFEFGALRFTEDGVFRIIKNALGTATLNLRAGEIPRFEFEFLGALHGVPTESALGAQYDAAWNNVQVITDDNAGDIRLGASFNASTGAISSGTVYPSFGLTLRLGWQVQHSQILGLSGATFESRKPEIDLELYLSAAQDITLEAIVRDITYTTLAWQIGTTAGKRFGLWFPRVQLAEVQSEQRDGRLMRKFKVYPVPTGVARDDDWRLITR